MSAPKLSVPEPSAVDQPSAPPTEPERAADARPLWWVAPVFFASGFSALLYQTVWQRALEARMGSQFLPALRAANRWWPATSP